MEWIRRNGPGILACLCIAVPAWFLGRTFEVVGGPVFAILLGMVMALFWKEQGRPGPASLLLRRRYSSLRWSCWALA